VRLDEGDDRRGELIACVFLQEVAGAADDRVLDPGRARYQLPETGAIPLVIGSASLNAARNGLSQAASRSQAARFGAEAGSSGVTGTSPGIARGPAMNSGPGNGAS
jgi:hypothetical protein